MAALTTIARRLLIAGLLAAALLTLVSGAPAGAPPPATQVQPAANWLVADRGASVTASRLADSAITWIGGSTTATTGESVTVFVSAALPPEVGTPQAWADFLARVTHGSELSALTTYIATLEEVHEICGSSSLGCYTANRMVAMGEPRAGVTAAEVVRHEYGHHIAFHRNNTPWSALDWGPKYWASVADVCRRVAAGAAFPGDQGSRYRLNPGEAWAETYRLLDERRAGATGSGWQIIDWSFYPSDSALQAAERDVLQPWVGAQPKRFSRRFAAQTASVWFIPLRTLVDGKLDIHVSLPKGGLHDVVLLASDRGKTLQKALWSSGRTKSLSTTVCGQRSMILRVTARGASGRVAVTATAP